jgi:phospholipase C
MLLMLFAFSLALSAGAQAAAPHAAPADDQAQLIAHLRAHVRHVFVIYQENRSFDSYFGDFPGVDNLATPEARAHGFREWDAIGKTWITPFLLNVSDSLDADHSRIALIAKTDHGLMDKFVDWEEENRMATPQLARQTAILTMGYNDCRTVPFLWMYAHHFTLYDQIFQGMYGPSTPGNIDLIAGQTGETEAARHPQDKFTSVFGPGDPVVGDANPAFGPYADPYQAQQTHQLDQTYATLMLTLKGRDADQDAKVDIDDVKKDIGELARLDNQAIPWAWYQEGFGDGEGNDHPAYIPHHNAPQYFGYIRQNPKMWSGVHSLLDFFTVMKDRQLPAKSVVFIKGGRENPFGWKPADPKALGFVGDDDHPGYSDSQLSESLVAKTVDTIARSPYWDSSAIIVLWDDSEGFYDHVPPPQFETCPDKNPCGDGPRIPLILISPWARAGGVDSNSGDHASFAKFLDVLFDLPPLGSLPDEKPYLPQGPRDTNPRLSDLVGGFDPARLAGMVPPIPASQAEIPDSIVDHFPPAMSCKDTGVEPVPIPGGSLTWPKGFTNPLP